MRAGKDVNCDPLNRSMFLLRESRWQSLWAGTDPRTLKEKLPHAFMQIGWMENYFRNLTAKVWAKFDNPRGGSSFFPRGGGLTQRRCGASSTSRVAASRFFLLLFWTPVSDVFLASTNGMMAFFYAQAMSEPRSGEPIFLGLFWTPVSDVFLASTNHMMAFFYAHITCSLGSPRGGGGV